MARVQPTLDAGRVAQVRRLLLRWYRHKGRDFGWRRGGVDPYVQVLTEVLLQRTRAETVEEFLPGFIERFPGWATIAAESPETIGTYLTPIGLWRRRGVALSGLARALLGLSGKWPNVRSELEAMPAVGQYVANAVLMFVHGECQPLLDGGMARVLERVFGPRTLADIRDDPWLQQLSTAIVRSRSAKRVNWALLDLAALVCTVRDPNCPDCPLVCECRMGLTRRRATKSARDDCARQASTPRSRRSLA